MHRHFWLSCWPRAERSNFSALAKATKKKTRLQICRSGDFIEAMALVCRCGRGFGDNF
jgi:hypothetical protein